MKSTVPHIVRNTLTRYRLLPGKAAEDSPGSHGAVTPFVLMVSGGADSVALFRLYLEGAFGDHPAAVVHLNHMLRGETAVEDEQFVRDLCEEHGVPFVSRRVDVAALAAQAKENIEAVGRDERYKFAHEVLEQVCQEAGVAAEQGSILTAHTMSDRVETFLMRTIKGGGTRSFASIQRTRGVIIRPLLDVTGEALRDYLRELGQPWREDATNADTNHLRAYVRHEIVPLMVAQNPRFEETLARSMDLISDEVELLDELTHIEVKAVTVEQVPEEKLMLDIEPLAQLSPALAKRVIRTQIIETFSSAYRIEAFHIEEIVNSLNDNAGFVSDITGGLRVRIEYGTLTVLPIARAH